MMNSPRAHKSKASAAAAIAQRRAVDQSGDISRTTIFVTGQLVPQASTTSASKANAR
jgi:hypothetical protein